MLKENRFSQKVVPCTFIGDGMVGKTSLARAFVNRQPLEDAYKATVFDNYSGIVSLNGEQYTVKIFDSPGQHDYKDVRAFSYRDSEVIVICYSVVDQDSFLNISDVWSDEIKSQIKKKKPIVLIGCQTDLRIPSDVSHVTKEQGMELAKEIGAAAFVECSSATLNGVTDAFQTIVNLALKSRKRKSKIFHRFLRK